MSVIVGPSEDATPAVTDDDEASQDAEECLRELLGGISFDGVAADAWGSASSEGAVGATAATALVRSSASSSATTPPVLHPVRLPSPTDTDPVFQNAFRCAPSDYRISNPPVQVVSLPDRGNGLIATTDIAKGAVIYTEQAWLSAAHDVTSVRACQYCFRSLEPISKLQGPSEPDHPPLALPLPHLWPVPDLRYSQETIDRSDGTRVDDHGRVTCRTCGALFCSALCRAEFQARLGSCCASTRAAAHCPDDPVMALTMKMYAYSLQCYRTQGTLDHSMLRGLCGDAADVPALELGDWDAETHRYSLARLQGGLVTAYDMSPREASRLSLDYLHQCASMAARNGVGLVTQSPFRPYYAALLRTTGGRNTAEHDAMKRRVALALGSDTGVLQRRMDREIDGLVAPHVSALLLLTARINHSCAPNACIQSQVFCDTHMDLVSLRDIQKGEEITISYIATGHGVGKKSTSRRRRELQSKYLFVCQCSECSQ